jgi:ankyrin repeat protein
VVARVLDRDPGALDRPFRAYASIEAKADQWWPAPDATPLEWATEGKKVTAAGVLIERGAGIRTEEQLQRAERIVSFLQSACWDHEIHGKGDHRIHDRAAQRILANDPSIATDDLYTAIVCGEIETVRRFLAERPGAARQPGGARGWTPILYLAYTRFTHPKTIDNTVEIARLLLDAGANPDDFYMAGDAQYSVLVGVAGEGEQDSPRQPWAGAMFDLVLGRGAKPFDIQVLYNTHFSGDMLWWLELVYDHTIGTPLGAAWRDPEWNMFDMGGYGSGARFILEVVIKKRDLPLAEWALGRGASPHAAPARDKRFPKLTLYEFAVAAGAQEIAELLARHGAARSAPLLDDKAQYVDACLALDRIRVEALLRAHHEYRTSPRAMFEAARRDRPDALALLLDVGVPIEVQDPTGKRALHEAAISNALRAARFLIARGAEIDPRESTYGGAPIGWAAHADHLEMIDLLSERSRNIWILCLRGYVDRVRAILSESPSLARELDREGCTPLWWLPDDERKAMAIVELLLAGGADAAHRNRHGNTAASWARRRGMTEVAGRLDEAAPAS